MLQEGKKKFKASVNYSVTVNFNPNDMPDEYKAAGFYMESTYMETKQVYKVIAHSAEDVKEYIKMFVKENLPLGSKVDDIVVEEDV